MQSHTLTLHLKNAGGTAMIRLKVKEVAQQKGISQGKLSRLADVNINTMRKIFRFPTSTVVTTDTLDRIAEVLDVDISELVESVPKEQAEK